LGGTPVFKGTRVPVSTLFDYLAAGDPLEGFLDDFPTVKRKQAVAILVVHMKEHEIRVFVQSLTD